MIETEITILVNRKTDLDQIRQIIIENNIQFPVYIIEFDNHYQIELRSDYEEWELNSTILNYFPEYEFTSNPEKGRKEIRLQISRTQSEFCTDGWGRPIENPLNETKYLIKKSKTEPVKFNPKIKVLFEESEQDYYINIVDGINKTSGEKGFLLLNEFKTKNDNDETEILKDRLYKTPLEAFHFGQIKIEELVNQDFKEYIKNKKKKLREQRKVPRKIIRDFINSCNKSENEEIFKNIDENIIYEKRINWQTNLRIEGIKEFKEYIKSPNQELCAKNFKIRSSWDFKMPSITIGVKYFPVSTNNDDNTRNIQQYRQIRFVLKDNKITNIIEES